MLSQRFGWWCQPNFQCGFPFPACIAIKLRQGILCDMVGDITGLFLLLCIKHLYDRNFHNMNWETMALQMHEGNKKLSIKESKSLTKEKELLVYPTKIHQLQQGLLTYVQLLKLVFGSDSYIAAQVMMWHEYIQLNHTHYTSLAFSKNTLPTQIAMLIQSSVVAFLTDCDRTYLARVNMDYINFKTWQQEIMTGTFHFFLMADIRAKLDATASTTTATSTVSCRHPAPSPANNSRPINHACTMPHMDLLTYIHTSHHYHRDISYICLNHNINRADATSKTATDPTISVKLILVSLMNSVAMSSNFHNLTHSTTSVLHHKISHRPWHVTSQGPMQPQRLLPIPQSQ